MDKNTDLDLKKYDKDWELFNNNLNNLDKNTNIIKEEIKNILDTPQTDPIEINLLSQLSELISNAIKSINKYIPFLDNNLLEYHEKHTANQDKMQEAAIKKLEVLDQIEYSGTEIPPRVLNEILNTIELDMSIIQEEKLLLDNNFLSYNKEILETCLSLMNEIQHISSEHINIGLLNYNNLDQSIIILNALLEILS